MEDFFKFCGLLRISELLRENERTALRLIDLYIPMIPIFFVTDRAENSVRIILHSSSYGSWRGPGLFGSFANSTNKKR